jgi:hypothetical protein
LPEPVTLLMIEFLTWVGERPRTYAEAMEAWRSTCPRFTVWEDAAIDGFIEVENGTTLQGAPVTLTARGRAVLEAHEAVDEEAEELSAGLD